MRVLLLFDVPTASKEERRLAAKFRKELIKQGFIMLQFSVYFRVCRGLSAAENIINNIESILPPRGNVRAMSITEKQFDKMRLLLGNVSADEKLSDTEEITVFNYREKITDDYYG